MSRSGLGLSGGLDSSTVVSFVNKIIEITIRMQKAVGKIRYFLSFFPGGRNNEEKYVDKLVNELNPLRQGFEGQANVKSYKVDRLRKVF